ncbi:hypothetical protein Goari_020433 [Gossypium aridum]|uniref:Uncharacterized protein n=1 Tax=Gossypium aridum TaxID=34290 RepID=A0A7J8YUJ5_GOSAI|nr:hypothetical protein [Gossypium aridum]
MPINRMIGSNYNNSPSRTIYSDRFIPSRSDSNFALFDIFNSPASDQRKKTVPLLIKVFYAPRWYDESGPSISHSPVKAPRKVPTLPYKVSDAPGLEDDFYLNLVHWSPNNVLAVGLESCVYFWNACSNKVSKLCDLGIRDSVCSVGWAQCGTHLAVGTNNWPSSDMGCIQLLHCRTMEGHRSRVGVLA